MASSHGIMTEIEVDTLRILNDNRATVPKALELPTLEEIIEQRKKSLVIIMLLLFGDESYDGQEESAFAVSGVIGRQEDWDALSISWNKRTGGIPFHATDCENGYRSYKHMPLEERQKLYRDLVNMLVNTNLMGKAISIDLKALKTAYTKIIRDAPYVRCFHLVVVWGAKMGYLAIPREKVNFTFEIGAENKPNHPAIYLFENMMRFSNWKYSSILDQVSFASKKSHIGLQVADIFAREAMKYSQERFGGSTNIREPIKIMTNSNKFSIDLFDKESIKELKEIDKEDEAIIQGYKQWLKDGNHRVDNFTLRQRYFLREEKTKS